MDKVTLWDQALSFSCTKINDNGRVFSLHCAFVDFKVFFFFMALVKNSF